MKKTPFIILLLSACLLAASVLQSCKSCNKKGSDAALPVVDSAALNGQSLKPSNTLNAPHGDTTLIPILSELLNKAFDAAAAKDYATLATYLVYRGPDSLRHGQDVFTLKTGYEKNVVRITGEVMNKWKNGAESVEYVRLFEMPQPGNRTLQVLEVIVVKPKNIDRKFYGFLDIKGEYKIADVTSWL